MLYNNTNNMIRYSLKKKTAQDIIRILAAHDKVVITDGENDLLTVQNKPARRGELHGNAKGKKPTFEERQAFTGTLYLKSEVQDKKQELI